jgi:intracellular sulfur oxidation DsrE/DsrF family protein
LIRKKWGGFKMIKRSKSTIMALIFLFGLLSTSAIGFASQEENVLKGLNSVKAVFDFRHGPAKSAAIFLDLIHDTYKGKDVAGITKKPEFVVVFIGPSAKLISNNREGVPPEDHKMLDAIAEKISEMTKDGINFEICLFAARMFNVDPATILSDIKHVENGVISLIGYQAKEFSLVPIY